MSRRTARRMTIPSREQIRSLADRSPGSDARPWLGPALLALAAGIWLALAPVGMDWGLPNARSWSNDDIAPKFPLQAPGEWRAGTNKYPYLQAFIDRALYEPDLRRWAAEGSFDPACDAGKTRCFEQPDEQLGKLLWLSRMRSMVMGLLILGIVYALGMRLWSDGLAAGLAAIAAALTQELLFFGHLGNLDVPQSFWFILSIWAYAGLVIRGDRASYWLFGLTGACAIGTKDGIVGAYLLPAVLVLVLHAKRAGWLGRRDVQADASTWIARLRAFLDLRLLGLIVLLFGTYALIMNPIFNLEGFRAHLDHWLVEEGISGYNDDFEGFWLLTLEAIYRLRETQGWPLFLLSTLGFAIGLRDRSRRMAWLLLPALSYLIFTILPIRFVYNRFMLPVAVLMALPAGLAGAALWRQRGAWRWVARPALVLTLAYSLLYGLTHLLGMAGDTRYAAEDWMREHAPLDAVVHTLGPEEYLPRVAYLGFDREQTMNWDELGPGYPLEPSPEAKEGVPDYVVMSEKSWPRDDDEEWPIFQRLMREEAGYAIRFDAEHRPALESWLPGAWLELRVSPRIVILERVDG